MWVYSQISIFILDQFILILFNIMRDIKGVCIQGTTKWLWNEYENYGLIIHYHINFPQKLELGFAEVERDLPDFYIMTLETFNKIWLLSLC